MLYNTNLKLTFRSIFLIFSLLLFPLNHSIANNVRHYSNDNGLGNDHIKGLAFDRYGYLWIGTESGLKRFDGAEFKTYNISIIKPDIKYENRVVNLFPMKDGSVMGIFTNGLTFRAIGDTVAKYTYPIDIFGPLIQCRENDNFEVLNSTFCCRKLGPNFFIQYLPYKGISIIDLKTCNFIKNFKAPDASSSNIPDRIFNYGRNELNYIDKNLKIWKMINNKWKNEYKITGLKNYSNLNPENIKVKNNLFDSSTFLLINSDIYYLSPDDTNKVWKSQLVNSKLPKLDVLDITYSSKFNCLAIGTVSDGLYIVFDPFSKNETKIFKTAPARGLIFIDSNTLLTSNFKILKDDSFTNFKYIQSGPTSNFFIKDRLGRIVTYINNQKPVILRSKSVNSTVFETFPVTFNDNTRFFIEDNNGRLWLFFTNIGTVVLSNPSNGPPQIINQYKNIKDGKYAFSKSKTLKIFCNNENYYEVNTKSMQITHKTIKNLPNNIRSMFETGKDTYLISTYGSGLKLLANNRVMDLPPDRYNALICSHCITPINQDRLLISTNNGLIIFNRSDIIKYLTLKTEINYTIYKNFPGFKSEFNGECYPCNQVKDNNIYYPHIEGVARIDLRSLLQEDINIPKFKLDSMAFGIGGMTAISSGSQVITMPANSNILHLKTSMIYWGDRSNLSIRAIVENGKYFFDTIFQNNKPVFENLPTGENIIKLDLFNSGKLVESISIMVIVPKKYYQLTSFWILIISVFLAFTLSGIFLYNNFLIKRNNELQRKVHEATEELETLLEKITEDKLSIEGSVQFKNRIISVITHDVLGPINFTNIILSSISSNLSNENRLQIEEIKKSNERIVNQAYEILTWSKAQNSALYADIRIFNIHDLVSEIFERNHPLANKNSIHFFNLIGKDKQIKSDRNILTIILNNLIENAFKYGKDKASISFEETDHFYEFTICNSGTKFNSEYIKAFNLRQFDLAFKHNQSSNNGGYGLRICQEILQVLGGSITIDDTQIPETKVYVKIPVKFNDAPKEFN